jgi:hypothetical protein
MLIPNTVRLFAGAFILAVGAFGQISIVVSPTFTTTRTSNLPPVGIGGSESAQVILTNTAANPATSCASLFGCIQPVGAPSCTGSVSFYNGAGTLIGTATSFTLTSRQIEQVSIPYSAAGSSLPRALIRAVVSLTTTIPSTAPCSLSYSLVIFDSTLGVTHAIVTDSGLSAIVTPLLDLL